ncbi:MAG TPA: hypothetical protein VGG70_10090 [Candidatus Cybelea sp.]|jgi:virginiamycin B lyase
MIRHIAIYSALAALAAATPGCAGSGTTGALPQETSSRVQVVSPSAHERIRIREFADLPRYNTYYSPGAIAAGPAGLVWVVDGIDQDFGANAVVGIATSGKSKHTYYAGSNYQSFADIAAGPDGALWLTDDFYPHITRLTTTGDFTQYAVSPNTDPFDITTGPDNALWFTASASGSSGAIERLTTKGRVTAYDIPAQPADIATGSDGALWFTETSPNGIGRITTHGKATSYANGITGTPQAIALGPDGAMWFTEYSTSSQAKIGRITTSGRVAEYSRGITPGEVLADIAAGPDGAMWFTESTFGYYYYSPKIGRISMSGHVTEYSKGLPSQAGPYGIVAGPDGRMWFTDSFNDETGRVKL